MATAKPGSVLQRREKLFGDEWMDYKVDGKTVTAPVDIETLLPGEYRVESA